MGRENELRKSLFKEIIEWARNNLEDEIDAAYEYFWEEEYPEDYLQGVALEIGFVNFEDWLLYDRKISDSKGLIGLYIETHPDTDKEALSVLEKMKDSVISLYEVTSKGKTLVLKDLLFDTELKAPELISPELASSLKSGDVFATRFLNLDGVPAMADCIYPFGRKLKADVLNSIKGQYERYRKNENPNGTLRDFLKSYSDVFNTIWYSELFGRAKNK